MRVLFIDGYDEHDAMAFEERFKDLEGVARDVEAHGGRVEYEDAGGEFLATVSVLEFGDVDPAFITFMNLHYVDYDMTKAKNFHILKEDAE